MGVILNKPDLSGYMTVEDYQTDEEVVAAALNDLDGRIKTVAEDVKANSTQKGMYGQISRDESSGYLAVNKKPTTLGDKILIDQFVFPLGNSDNYNLAVVGNYAMHDQDIEGVECNICLRIRVNNGEHTLPTRRTLYIHPMGSSDNPERAYEIAAVSSEEIVVRYHGGDEIYRFTINDPQLYSDGVYIPLTKTFVNSGYQYNRLISEEISVSRELSGQWGSILTVDLAIPQTIAEAEMDEYGSLIWKAVPTLSDNILRDTAGKNYIPTNKAVAYHTKNFTRRFETEYVRGEDDIASDGTYVDLGDFSPAIQYQDLKAGDIIDVAPKKEDITNVIFRNNGTESIHTEVYYASQDLDNFVPGTPYYCIRYERIADFPSDPDTQMSTLIFYKKWISEDGFPVPPFFIFQAQPKETESGVTGLIPLVGFVGFNSTGEPVLLNPDSDYVGFIENESSSHFFCTEVVINRGVETTTLTPKRQDDGVVSILDYYKFYYVAEGKTYIMSRDGNYARPLDVTKSVIELYREELKNQAKPIILEPSYDRIGKSSDYMTRDSAAALLGCSVGDLEALLDYRYTCVINRNGSSAFAFRTIVPQIAYRSKTNEISSNIITLYFGDSSLNGHLLIERNQDHGWRIEYTPETA